MTITQSSKFVTLFAGVAVAGALVFGAFAAATPAQAALSQSQVDAIVSLLQSFGADAATIANVKASLTGGTPTVPPTTGGGTCPTLSRSLQQGSTGSDVQALQIFLNGYSTDTRVSISGAGSPGSESTFFGPATHAAVVKFQAKNSVSPIGIVGPQTRAAIAAVCGGVSPGPGPAPAGAVSIMAGSQPANTLVPANAASVAFTTFTITNNSASAVTVNSVTVERTGLAQDSVFSGVILMDSGMRLGNTKTLNSNHQATLDANVTIQPGQSKTLTIAGDIGALTSQSGQVASLSVVAVNTNGTVSGSLPIVGASHTTNNTLTIGSLTVRQGPSDPDNASLSKEIGTTNYVVASLNASAGSTEAVWLRSIRWNQSGSAAQSDISNVRTTIDGVDYPGTIDASGKYYSVVFPGNGLKIDKGFTKEILVKVNISGGSNRTINFDIYKAADIYAVGDVYGYGIAADADANTASASTDASEFITSDGTASGTSGTPFFSGTKVTITGGSVTSFSRASEVPTQNIAENTANQPLGGFAMDVNGEGISVQQMIFMLTASASAGGDGSDIDSVTLVDENGAVVAGPVDAVQVGGTNSKVTFTDTVTFPTGRHIFTIKGKLGTDFNNGDSIQASTTPSSDWSNITGQSTGDTISLSSLSSAVTGNTMTLRTGLVALSVSGTPAAQNVVAGITNATFSNIIFDATNSGEDVKFTSIKLYYDENNSLDADPTNCHIWDGATRLTSSAVNPNTDGDDTYTLDTNLVVTKGTSKTVAVKCDLSGSATTGDFDFGINFDTTAIATFTGVGASSGTTITPSTPSAAITGGNSMTVSSGGALTVSEDSSSPSYKVAAGGTTGVTIGVLRFNGTNEDMRLDRVGLTMSNAAATSTPSDLTQVTLWDGATQVGSAVFSGSNRYATSTLTSTNVIVPANGFKQLTVKADLSQIGTGQAGESGVLIQVDYDGGSSVSAGGCSTRAYGQSSGSQICSTTAADTSFDGVRMFRAYPTVAQLALPSTALTAGTVKDLTRFSVTASNNGLGIGLSEITLSVATSSGSNVSGSTTVENFDIYAYTDSSFSSPVSGFTDGLVYDGTDGIGVSGTSGEGSIETELTSVLQIAAGQTVYFKVVADITFTNGTGAFVGNVTTKLLGDAAFPADEATLMTTETDADADATNDDFIWSPNSTTTSANAGANADWTNGYGVPGLPSAGLSGNTLTY